MSVNVSAFDQVVEAKEKLARLIREQGESIFKEKVNEFFKENPAIKAFAWSQYTPYFNDGEPCEFSVNPLSFTTAEDLDEDEKCGLAHEDGGFSTWSNDGPCDGYDAHPGLTRETYKACRELDRILTSNDMQDIVLSIFGDHVTVFVTPQEVIVEEYDHD